MLLNELIALKKSAVKIRKGILEAVYAAQSGHPGGSLSIADLLAVLMDRMHIDPSRPDDPDRDRLVLSKGHAAPALYAALAQRGFFPETELRRLRPMHGMLQGHPDMHCTPGVDISTGSLGLGFSAAAGMALYGQCMGSPYRVYCILGDGELEEGIVWEAAAMSSRYALDHLTAFVDVNGLQIDGTTAQVLGGGREAERFLAFGWNVLEIDGHDLKAIADALKWAEDTKGRPGAVLLRTVKGKGISYMEDRVEWHGQAPNEAQYLKGITELDQAWRALEAEV